MDLDQDPIDDNEVTCPSEEDIIGGTGIVLNQHQEEKQSVATNLLQAFTECQAYDLSVQ